MWFVTYVFQTARLIFHDWKPTTHGKAPANKAGAFAQDAVTKSMDNVPNESSVVPLT